jgi:uridine phosphorylase
MLKRIIAGVFVVLTFFQSVELNAVKYTAADLPIIDGKVYHLQLTPEQLAPNIIIVGDPDRVPVLANHCLLPVDRFDVSHRGLRTITGITPSGLRVSIVTSGMGTPSTEIVLNELIVLNEIDLQTSERRAVPLYETLNIIRLGTSGALQSTTKLGIPIITEYTVGLDNTGLFYDVPATDETTRLEYLFKQAIDKVTRPFDRFCGKIHPYAAKASQEIVEALFCAAAEEDVEVIKGITVSSAGFFANQGRDISRVKLTVPNIDRVCSEIVFEELKAENMEMEASFICHFGGALGCRTGAICPVIAHRREDTFYADYEDAVLDSLKIIIKAFEKLS